MAKSAMCLKCGKGRIGIYSGKFLSVRRQDTQIVVSGKDFSVLAHCPKCGEMNSVGIQTTKNEQGQDVEELTATGKIEEITTDQLDKIINNKEEINNEENSDKPKEGEGDGSGEPKENGDGKSKEGDGSGNTGIQF